MKTEFTRKHNFTPIDAINTVTAISLAKVTEPLEVSGLALAEEVDTETGEVREIAYLKTTDGCIYGTVSETAQRSIRLLADLFEADETADSYECVVETRKSGTGRDYITIRVVG